MIERPACAPELNPMENVWAYLRANKLCARVWNSYEAIQQACLDAWNFLGNDPERIRSIGKRDWATVNVWGAWYKRVETPGVAWHQAGWPRLRTSCWSGGISVWPGTLRRLPKRSRNLAPFFTQVLARPGKASRQPRPRLLRVAALVLRRVTRPRTPFSDPLACSGISGRSSATSGSALLACRRLGDRSNVAKPVRRRKMRSKRARNASRRRSPGLARQAFRPAQKAQISRRIFCWAARCRSVKALSLCASRSA